MSPNNLWIRLVRLLRRKQGQNDTPKRGQMRQYEAQSSFLPVESLGPGELEDPDTAWEMDRDLDNDEWGDDDEKTSPRLWETGGKQAASYGGEYMDDELPSSYPWPMLTEREVEVAWCMRLGYSNEEIARQLGISIGTVKTHVHNLLVKFNLRSRWVLRDLLIDMNFNPWGEDI